ncbi:dATP/dGTP diphosphohydrolase domain-containing protein [Corallococcus sp. AB018]|uniref:dATP/dGTP diphosphohydrolase domain-containing protein n=1 Tax=Corallococcus sp. AB018 TaxID=2316715 RepID=UPI0018F2C371|nr:dATP/dGTP diphosphohydrolase domain-containing protein [Corallococcus sp. AB018]
MTAAERTSALGCNERRVREALDRLVFCSEVEVERRHTPGKRSALPGSLCQFARWKRPPSRSPAARRNMTPKNFRCGTNWRCYVGAALRHTLAFTRGEDTDPETGLSHLADAAACLMILRELQIDSLGTDDRIKGSAPVARWFRKAGEGA